MVWLWGKSFIGFSAVERQRLGVSLGAWVAGYVDTIRKFHLPSIRRQQTCLRCSGITWQTKLSTQLPRGVASFRGHNFESSTYSKTISCSISTVRPSLINLAYYINIAPLRHNSVNVLCLHVR